MSVRIGREGGRKNGWKEGRRDKEKEKKEYVTLNKIYRW